MSRYVTIGITLCFALSVYFFFRFDDEKHIKKTTLQMINQMATPIDISKMAAVLRRIRNITEPMHFSINIIFSEDDRILFKEESLAQVKGLLGAYFKNQPTFQLKKLNYDNLHFSIQEKEDQKIAALSFVLQGGAKGRTYKCRVLMGWKYEKEWKIYEIKGSECKNLNF